MRKYFNEKIHATIYYYNIFCPKRDNDRISNYTTN